MGPTSDHGPHVTRGLIPHSRPSITRADARAVARSVVSRTLVGGDAVSGFEAAVARRAGTAHGCAVGSGTAALHLALMSLGVGPGDEVVLPAYVCAAPLYAVRYVGARAVLADVNPETGISEAGHIRAVLSRRTRAVIAVHLFGRAAPVDDIVSLGVPVLEDCAQSLGGTYRNRPLGSWGAASVFSFYATKVITTGLGGMVCSGDAELIGRVRDLIRYDERTDGGTAYPFGMAAPQAALGTSQMERIDDFLRRRRAIHDFYRETFLAADVELAPPAPTGEDIHYRFVVRTDRGTEEVIGALAGLGVTARRPVFRPLFFYEGTGELPGTGRAYDRNVSIPLYPALTDGQARRVAGAVVRVFAGRP
jgi:perosamine synthetase